jgi:hypothetical protein
MAEKRPICLYGGDLQELQAGDTLPGSGGGGSGVEVKTLTQPGELILTLGSARWYPVSNISIDNIKANVGYPALGNDLIIDVNKNGQSIVAGGFPILTGQNESADITPTNLTVTPSDYITVDIMQIGAVYPGSDLAVTIQFTRT